MTGVRIRIEAKGDGPARAALAKAAAQADNLYGLFDNIGMSLVVSTQARFERGEDPEGNPWPQSIRVQLGQGTGKALIDSARLMQSITHEPSSKGVEWGTNAIYAAIHQFGGTIRPVNAERLVFKVGGEFVTKSEVTIPARPFLGLDDDDEEEIAALVEDWLLGEEGAGVHA